MFNSLMRFLDLVLISVFIFSIAFAQESAQQSRPRVFDIEDGKVSPAKPSTEALPQVALPLPKDTVVPPTAPYALMAEGWQTEELARKNDAMSDGLTRPGQPSSMACFEGPQKNQLTIVSNHEIAADNRDDAAFAKVINDGDVRISLDLIFTRWLDALGCCTRTTIDSASAKVLNQQMALLGTSLNSGGTFLGQSFFSSERLPLDSVSPHEDHGNIFEVPAFERGLSGPTPIMIGGKLSFGAICADPVAQVFYFAEAREDGLLYRWKPKLWNDLSRGGSLSVLAVENSSLTENNLKIPHGGSVKTFWTEVISFDNDQPDLHVKALRLGGSRIGRVAGMAIYKGQIVLSCAGDGLSESGQIVALEDGKLHLYAEAKADEGPILPGNLLFTANGELLVCEKRKESSRLMIFDRQGSWKVLLWVKDGPIGGVAISPDERFIFVNLQSSGTLLALARKQ